MLVLFPKAFLNFPLLKSLTAKIIQLKLVSAFTQKMSQNSEFFSRLKRKALISELISELLR